MRSHASIAMVAGAVGLALGTTACGSDSLHDACKYTESAFDIEEVSVLEDATGWPGYHDAVALTYDTSRLPANGTWRVSQVDVLVMIGASVFSTFPPGLQLGVEVFDGTTPSPAYATTVWQTLDKAALSFTPVTLTNPSEALENEQMRAWWTFDFAAVAPAAGMQSASYIAGVVWPGSGAMIKTGYSNFNRACNKNWTDYADGRGFVMNGLTGGEVCSWPMLRVKVEVTDPAGKCQH
ncbi:MAG: hypothetical protein HY903_01660 [Deltaproteobacteria bacterium]|nr:hypothetical protein [Deltaproteobacteria bacterium]